MDRRDIASILKLDAIFKTAYPRRWNKAEEESSSVLEIIFEQAFQTNKRWKSTIFVSFSVDVFASFTRNLLFFFSKRTQCSSISQTTRSLLLNAIIFLFYFYLRKRNKIGCGWFWKIKNVKFAIIKAMLDLNFLRFLICN